VAAWCCGLLLRRAGFDVLLKPGSRPRLPAVMLSDAAVALMRDVFGKADLFHAAPRVVKRIVAWGPDPKVVVLDHAAVVVSEQDLLEALGTQIIDDDSNAPPDWTPDWPPTGPSSLHARFPVKLLSIGLATASQRPRRSN